MNSSAPLPPKKALALGGLLFLAAAAGVSLFLRLRAYADPSGMNGYFYLKQSESLAFRHEFYFGDHSLAFLPLTLLTKITGNSLLSFQLMTSVSLTLSLLAIFSIAAAPLRKEPLTLLAFGLLATAGLVASSFAPEFFLNFHKNALAFTGVLFAGAALSHRRPWLALGCFFAAFLTHKSTALVGATALASGLLIATGYAWRSRKISRRLLAQIALTSLGALAFSLLFLFHFPKAQAFLAHLSGWIQPAGPRLGWFNYVFTHNLKRALEISSALTMILLYLGARPRLPAFSRVAGDSLTLFLALALQPWQEAGEATISYRLLLLLPLASAGLAALTYPAGARAWRAVTAAALALPLLAYVQLTGFSKAAVAKEIRVFSPIREQVEKIPQFVNQEDHLTSHHGLEFFIDYVTNIRSRSFVAEPGSQQKKFRVAFVPPQRTGRGPVRDELLQAALLDLGGGYILLPESDWLQISRDYGMRESWRNPSWQRPAHVYQ